MSDMGSSGVANYALTSIGQAVRTMGVVGVAGGEVNVAGPSLALDFMPDFGNVNPQLDPRITFSRASNATVTGSNGLIRFAPHNLLTFSEQFDNAAWAKSAGGVASAPVVTANAGVAPNGTTTADQVVFNLNGGSTSSDLSQIQANSVAFQAGVALTQSVYLKTTDESSKVLSFVSIDGVVELITVTGTWQRFTLTTTPTSSGSNNPLRLRLRGNENTAQSASILAWGAQLEIGSTATAYNPTTVKNLLGFSEAFDNAAWTKSNSFIQTNLLTFSENFDNAAWVLTNVSGTASRTGNTLTFGANALDRFVQSGRTLTADSYTASITLSGTGSVRLYLLGGDGSTGAPTTITLTSTPTRYTVTRTPAAGGAAGGIGIYNNAAGTPTTVTINQAQLVQGSVAGDYQQTTSSALPVMYQAPNGTMTADKFVEDATSNAHALSVSATVVNGGTYTFSCYAKKAERKYLRLIGATNFTGSVNFDLDDGSYTITAGSPTVSVVNVGNGWYRCSITGTTSATTITPNISMATTASGTGAYAGNGTNGILVWGAQLSDSASLDQYVNNPVAAPSSTAYYGARFDYDPVTLQPRGLLIEEQRTNLLLRSEEFDNASWSKNDATVTANTTTSPNGTTTADKLIDNVNNIGHFITQAAAMTAGVSYTTSVYAKQSEIRYLVLRYLSGGAFSTNYICTFDLQTGIATNNPSLPVTSFSITSVGNGWYRCSITQAASSTANGTVGLFLSKDGSTTTYTGNGTDGAFIWGAQLEAGAFATSYIPTTSAQVTRSRDIAVVQGSNFSSWYNPNEGSLYASSLAFNQGDSTGNASGVTSLNNTTSSEMMRFDPRRIQVITGNVSQANITSISAIPSGLYRSAFTYASNYVAISTNGSAITPATSVNLPSGVNTMQVGQGLTSGGILNGHIRQIAYYPRRLSNQELQAITS